MRQIPRILFRAPNQTVPAPCLRRIPPGCVTRQLHSLTMRPLRSLPAGRDASPGSVPMVLSALIVITLIIHGCSPRPIAPEVSYPPKTTLHSAVDQCQGDFCLCPDEEESAPVGKLAIPPGKKRFEFRLPPSASAIWVSIEDKGQFYKAPEQVRTTCFYVDLPAGEHRIVLHSELRDKEIGLQTGLTIREYGPQTDPPSWYRSFDFRCGKESPCTKTGLAAWVDFQRHLPRGVLDPCGSVMIRKVEWGGQQSERQDMAYQKLTLNFSMKIYKFVPFHKPGSTECKAPIKN